MKKAASSSAALLLGAGGEHDEVHEGGVNDARAAAQAPPPQTLDADAALLSGDVEGGADRAENVATLTIARATADARREGRACTPACPARLETWHHAAGR